MAPSVIHGFGVFASLAFDVFEIILSIDDSRTVSQQQPLHPEIGEHERHCDYLAHGRVVLMQEPERYINHSCEPSTFVRTIAGTRYVLALRRIEPGEEITYDYCINGSGDSNWDCSCGAPTCRHHHNSNFFRLPLGIQARYVSLLDDWFVDEHRDEVQALIGRLQSARQ